MRTEFDVLIVGGGFAGIFAAWRLAHDGVRVALVEKSYHLGGTLWSQDWTGFQVDMGMHNFDLRASPDAEFYADILGDGLMELSGHSWGSTTGGATTLGFEMPDFSTSDPALCRVALDEMAAIKAQSLVPDPLPAPSDLGAFMRQKFGPTLGQRLLAMAGKVIGRAAETLSADTATTLGMLSRPKLGTDAEMVALKRSDPFWDARLGVSLAADAPEFMGRNVVQRLGYPASGSLRGFCLAARNRLTELGVALHLESSVLAIDEAPDGITLDIGSTSLQGQALFWTLPDQALLDMLGMEGPDLRQAVHPVGVVVHAFETRADATQGPDYLHDFTPERRSYRYSRPGIFGGQITEDGHSYVLAEIPSHPADAADAKSSDTAETVWADLKTSGFLAPKAERFSHMAWSYPVAYTLPTVGWAPLVQAAEMAIAQAGRRIVPISFGKRGRAQFIRHFDADLLAQLTETL